MTYRARQHWPAVAERCRSVVETRTANGQPCTIIIERDDSGLILSFHGAIRATAAPDPVEARALIEALRTAAGDRTPPP